MTTKELQFVKWVKKECKDANVEVSLRKVGFVKAQDGVRCAGYFEEKLKGATLVSSLNRPDWIEILAHEFSHMRQWQEESPIWLNSGESFVALDRWLSGSNVRHMDKHISAVRDLELDCEKRAVKLIKEWKLKVDIDNYIRKANAYVLFYNHLLKTRKWSDPSNSPYKNQKLIEAMSTQFRMNYKRTSKKVQKIFDLENI